MTRSGGTGERRVVSAAATTWPTVSFHSGTVDGRGSAIVIRYGKKFVAFEDAGRGPIVARFEDGAYTSGEAIMLVFTVAIVLPLGRGMAPRCAVA